MLLPLLFANLANPGNKRVVPVAPFAPYNDDVLHEPKIRRRDTRVVYASGNNVNGSILQPYDIGPKTVV